MNPADRDRLQRILATLDEPGLIALANPGLLRRARKDLEGSTLSHEETDTAILVRGPDWTVTMPVDGPTKATDSTKATGITRQILSAILYLQQHWLSKQEATADAPVATVKLVEEDTPILKQVLLDLELDDLTRWVGKNLFKQARAVAKETTVTISDRGLIFRLQPHEIEVRVLPGTSTKPNQLLDAMLCTAPKAQQKMWIVVAVLAFHQAQGKSIDSLEESTSVEPVGAAITRSQLLQSCRQLFLSMVQTGLVHLSDRCWQRLFTLSISASTLGLIRLSRITRSLSEEVSWILERHANGDTARLYEQLCYADALCRSIQATEPTPPISLTGRPRTEYEPLANLSLTGLGSYPWQSTSGYEGVTTLLWDNTNQRLFTVSSSRPSSQTLGFHLGQVYHSEAIWKGGGAAERIGKSKFTLQQPKANPFGRLSIAKDTEAKVEGPTQVEDLNLGSRLFNDWAKFMQYAATTYPLGLRDRNPTDRIVVLQPSRWGERVFDELQQALSWNILDEQDRELTLSLPWLGVNESAIEFLEAVKPDRDQIWGLVVRFQFDRFGLSIEPLTLLSKGTPQGHTVLCPAFDASLIVSKQSALLAKLREKYGRDRIATTMTTDEENADTQEEFLEEDVPNLIALKLRDYEQTLIRLAESGLPGRDQLGERLSGHLDFWKRCNLVELANPQTLLEAGYLTRLHRQTMKLAKLEQATAE